ncbi:hypothetical protein K440DRAFT_663876 [Wilcoxina mikolae CBS 423.85]|nr:hypothetical protein K440DRAFT_663876 [Wilcoxina mikolae CBS 423.85]
MASTTSEVSDVVSLYRICTRSFNTLFESLEASLSGTVSPHTIQEEQGRFRIWAENAGAHHDRSSPMSLDHRLREASEVKRTVINLLNALHDALNDAHTIISGNIPQADQSSDSTSDCEWYSTESESEEERKSTFSGETGKGRSTELEDCLADITHSITCLYKFSIAIQNPAPRDRLERCSKIDVSYFERFDIEHVGQKFPNATDYLRERFGNANTKRRQLLKYHEKHHTTIVGTASQPEASEAEAVETTDTKDADQTAAAHLGVAAPTLQTTVSTVREHNIPGITDTRSEGNFSQTSYASSANNPGTIHVPLPPNSELAFNGEPFLCPYCFSITSVDGKRSWMRHVFRDIRPYICTFEDCLQSDYLFGSRHEWFDHERQMHRRQVFTSRAEFENHLTKNHSNHFAPSELKIVVNWAESANELPQPCPLCSEKHFPRPLQRHLGRHMEQISLFVLPGTAEEGEEERKEGGESGSESRGSPSVSVISDAVGEPFNLAFSLDVDECIETDTPHADPKSDEGEERNHHGPRHESPMERPGYAAELSKDEMAKREEEEEEEEEEVRDLLATQKGKKAYTRFSKVHFCKEALDERDIVYSEEPDYFIVHRIVEKAEQQNIWNRTKEIRSLARLDTSFTNSSTVAGGVQLEPEKLPQPELQEDRKRRGNWHDVGGDRLHVDLRYTRNLEQAEERAIRKAKNLHEEELRATGKKGKKAEYSFEKKGCKKGRKHEEVVEEGEGRRRHHDDEAATKLRELEEESRLMKQRQEDLRKQREEERRLREEEEKLRYEEKERLQREEMERIQKEREKEKRRLRKLKEKEERKRIEGHERKVKEAAERKAREREVKRIREEEARKRKEEEARLRREEAKRKAREREEQLRKEEEERKVREKEERRLRKIKDDEERKRKEEEIRIRREEAERKAREEEERLIKLEEERKAREKEERRLRKIKEEGRGSAARKRG